MINHINMRRCISSLIKSMASDAGSPGFECWLCHLLAEWSELLNLSVLAYKMGIRVFISQGHCKNLSAIYEMTLLVPGTW